MTLFVVFALALVAVTAAFLVPPLWRGRAAASLANRKEANLAIFRDQLAELEREKAEGSLAQADFEQAKQELSRRLLEEVEANPEEAALARSQEPSRGLAIALLVLLPLGGAAGYALWGNSKALNPALVAPAPRMTPDQIEGMVARLAEKMKANPDDMQGWLMLARSYKAMGRYAEAADAYSHAESVVSQDASLLAAYAEALAMGGTTGLRGKPRQLVDQALKLDGNNPHALLLAGAAAMEAGNKAEAIRHWEKLLPQVEPGSEIDTMLRSSIDRLKQSAR